MIEYDEYRIDATSDFTWRHTDSRGDTEFFFELGSKEKGLWLERKPTKAPTGATPDQIALALTRVIDHLESVGYTIQFYDAAPSQPIDKGEFVKAHEDSGYVATENPDGSITVTRGIDPDAPGLIKRLKRLFFSE